METTGTGTVARLDPPTAFTGSEAPRQRVWIELVSPRDRLRREGAFLALASLVIALSFLHETLKSGGLWPGIPCLFNAVTHLPCLTCGLTRSFAMAAQGDLVSALEYHLLGPALFFLSFAAVAYLLFVVASGRRLKLALAPATRKVVSWSVLALFIAAWVLKVSFMKVTW